MSFKNWSAQQNASDKEKTEDGTAAADASNALPQKAAKDAKAAAKPS